MTSSTPCGGVSCRAASPDTACVHSTFTDIATMLTRLARPGATPRRVSLSAMRQIRGLTAALEWCEQRRRRLATPSQRADLTKTVADVVAAVARGGASEVLALTERFDRVRPDTVVVPPDRLEASAQAVSPGLRGAIDLAMSRVESYYMAQVDEGFE